MGVKDYSFIEYNKDPVRFADFMNGTVFRGERIVQADYLREIQRKKRLLYREEPLDESVQKTNDPDTKDDMKRENSKTGMGYLERERDTLMYHDKENARVYLACEGMAQPDYNMPLREFTYDGVEYSEQLKNRKPEKGKKMKTVRPLIPVFHQVLYMGEKRWLSKHTLKEMMNIPEEFEEFQDFLPDYRTYVTDIHEQTPDLFQTEWRDIFRLMNHSRKSEELKKYVEEHKEEIQGLSQDTRIFLAILLDQYVIVNENEVEVKDVCEAWNGAMLLYREEGKAEGRTEGRLRMLIRQISRKLIRNKSPELIAEELEETMDVVLPICEAVKKYAPDYDCDRIYEYLSGNFH
ncbi:MAG: hypothetical protein Q4C91_02935 [Eubacteriales bacterium]|nr:hypothetical protein [Eubacteriales bacterium]